MSDNEDTLHAALRALSETFVARLPGKLNEIQSALEQFQSNSTQREHIALLHRLLHTMAGAAGTFGLPELGTKAKELEAKIKPLLSGTVWSAQEQQKFIQQVQFYLDQSALNIKLDNVELALDPLQLELAQALEKKLIYLLFATNEQVMELVGHLEQSSFETKTFLSAEDFSSALALRTPDVLVIDFECCQARDENDGTTDVFEIVSDLKIPTIFVSSSNSFECRIKAVRAGGGAFFSKPIDILAMTETIDAITANQRDKRYRILIVDDDVAMTSYYRAILQGEGMVVEVLNEPTELLEMMVNFRPELLLMDVYMPSCDGIELSKVIRQDRSFLDVPIVFLSSEQDLHKQMEAVKVGADDFLSKPIIPELLISSISTRAERYRSLRTLVMRDGLTGLLNHSAIKESLIAKLSGANRQNNDLSLAMIDLDNFKRINDTYGHPVGDQVLRTLSHLLKQSLRKSDLVGRYGGEEFVVIFPNTSAGTAGAVLDKIRAAYANIVQYAENAEFTATFSAGISDSTQTTVPEDLIAFADAALYRAKNSGKNKVILGAD
ncbi:MAG: diguanylate cyclase [Undibacterium sp.]|nr:diguanylate cyclase [Undibacterium sp.]